MKRKKEKEIPFVKPELSIKECKEFVCKDGEEYTDEEIKEIKTLIINLVEIDYCYYVKCRQKKQTDSNIIDLNRENNNPENFKEAG